MREAIKRANATRIQS